MPVEEGVNDTFITGLDQWKKFTNRDEGIYKTIWVYGIEPEPKWSNFDQEETKVKLGKSLH